MRNTFLKYTFFLLIMALVVWSCQEDEGGVVIQEVEETFALDNASSTTSVVLNFSYPDNPAFTLTWDEGANPASSYNITFSESAEFTTSNLLGTSMENSFTITVGDLNTALTDAGIEAFTPTTIYVRAESDAATTASKAFRVTPYAVGSPELEEPTTTEYVLDVDAANDVAVTISFGDFAPENVGTSEDSKITLEYTLQTALGGTDFATPVNVASISNADAEITSTAFELTNKQVNDVALSAGIATEEQGTLDFRVRSVITNETGTQERVSTPITLTVTTYNTEAFPIYFVGAGTAAGWNNPASPITNHHPLFPNVDNPNQYSYTGYFANDGFKMIQAPGSWDSQWGAGAAGELSTDGGSGNLSTGAEGYFTFTADIGALTWTATPFDEASAPDYTANGMGITGAGVGGWDDPARIPMTQSTFDKHIWYATSVQFFDDEFKFKETNGWGVQFGANGGGSNSWPYDRANGGDNLRAQAGTYTVFFNDLTGDYWMIEE